jgi:hypothetical protein
MNRIVIMGSLLAACAPQQHRGPLAPDVQPGPAAGARTGRVLVLAPTCGSAEFRCPKNYIETVDAIVRATLEFTGFAVVDPERLRLQTRQRTETRELTESPASAVEKTTIVLDGPGFDDLTPRERDEVLDHAGADSIVVVRVVVGAKTQSFSAMANQNVEVMIRLAVDKGDTMAWASRCMASSADYATVTETLEQAARCAVFGGTGR